jgi:hypothetical protein
MPLGSVRQKIGGVAEFRAPRQNDFRNPECPPTFSRPDLRSSEFGGPPKLAEQTLTTAAQ